MTDLTKPAQVTGLGTATDGVKLGPDNPSLHQNPLADKLNAAWDAWHANPHNRRLELAFCKLAEAYGLPCFDDDGNRVSWRWYFEKK